MSSSESNEYFPLLVCETLLISLNSHVLELYFYIKELLTTVVGVYDLDIVDDIFIPPYLVGTFYNVVLLMLIGSCDIAFKMRSYPAQFHSKWRIL